MPQEVLIIHFKEEKNLTIKFSNMKMKNYDRKDFAINTKLNNVIENLLKL